MLRRNGLHPGPKKTRGRHDERDDGIPGGGRRSLICYLLVTRVQNRSARRQSAGSDGSGNDVSYRSGGDGWNIFSWSAAPVLHLITRRRRAIPAAARTAEAETAAAAVINAAKSWAKARILIRRNTAF